MLYRSVEGIPVAPLKTALPLQVKLFNHSFSLLPENKTFNSPCFVSSTQLENYDRSRFSLFWRPNLSVTHTSHHHDFLTHGWYVIWQVWLYKPVHETYHLYTVLMTVLHRDIVLTHNFYGLSYDVPFFVCRGVTTQPNHHRFLVYPR